MYIDRILAPVVTLGPGNRLVLWTAGCSKHCKGCANPELWRTAGKTSRTPADIAGIIHNVAKQTPPDGITFTGGDPLEQPADLLALLDGIQDITRDILVYTGFVYEELPDLLRKQLRERVAVLIDGRYIAEQNRPDAVLRGSANQRIFFFREEFLPAYREYMAKGRQIQNIYMGSKLISVGIHDLNA